MIQSVIEYPKKCPKCKEGHVKKRVTEHKITTVVKMIPCYVCKNEVGLKQFEQKL